MKDRSLLLNLYYLASKLAVVLFLWLVLFLKNAYGVEGYYSYAIATLVVAYLAVNLFAYLSGLKLPTVRALRFADYLLALAADLFAQNLYGVIPGGFIFGIYSVLYLRELFIVFLAAIAALLLNFGLFHHLPPVEFYLSLVFLLGVLVISTKYNIVVMLKERKETLMRLKEDITSRDRSIALLSEELDNYREVTEIVEKIAERRHLEDLPKILKNLLRVEEVIIRKKVSPYQIITPEGFITVSVRNILLSVKPKEEYLLKDRRFKEKLRLLVKVLRPYLERFLEKE